MIFNTLEFAALFLTVAALYFIVGNRRRQNVLLLVASYVFYGWWDYRFIPLLLVSTLIDYAVALQLGGEDRATRRRLLVTISCVANLGLLGFFKYWGLFSSTANGVGAWLGFDDLVPTLQLVLPVGISFYTFQSMSYTIEVYRRRYEPCRSLTDFALYVSFFPQLVAGPIERPQNLLVAVQKERSVSLANVEEGVFLFAKGWLLKSIADLLAEAVDPIYAAPADYSAWMLLWGIYGFAYQLYCDFFGYSQMARGIARILGFRLMENFSVPFLAGNIRDLWNRWHMSLTLWLRDYLFFSLGGSRGARYRGPMNLAITMTLAGLWHGAAWTFVVWGAMQGLLLAFYDLVFRKTYDARIAYLKARPLLYYAWASLCTFVTFHIFTSSAILFRAQASESQSAWANAMDYASGIIALGSSPWEAPPVVLRIIPLVIVFDVLQLRAGTSHWCRDWHWTARGMVVAALVLLALGFGTATPRPFAYFQF